MCPAPDGPVKISDTKSPGRRVLMYRAPQDGCTPLIIAAELGKEVAAQVLLEAGANMEAEDRVRARSRGEGRG